MKAKIKSCSLKKQGDNYSIYTVTLEDGTTGQSFDSFTEGEEAELEVVEDPKYGKTIKKAKQKQASKFQAPQKDWTLEKKKIALQAAVDFAGQRPNALSSDQVLEVAVKFYNFLKD